MGAPKILLVVNSPAPASPEQRGQVCSVLTAPPAASCASKWCSREGPDLVPDVAEVLCALGDTESLLYLGLLLLFCGLPADRG